MKRIRPRYHVSFEIELTAAEIEIIREHAARHYDAVCRDTVARGGFVYGWAVGLDMGRKVQRASWDEVDTVCKILERSSKPGHTRLFHEFHKLIFEMGKLSEQANRDD